MTDTIKKRREWIRGKGLTIKEFARMARIGKDAAVQLICNGVMPHEKNRNKILRKFPDFPMI